MEVGRKYKSFWSFYPYYLTEHKKAVTRTLHFTGTLLLIACLIAGIITGRWILFILIPFIGYGFAWVGHFFFEKNKVSDAYQFRVEFDSRKDINIDWIEKMKAKTRVHKQGVDLFTLPEDMPSSENTTE